MLYPKALAFLFYMLAQRHNCTVQAQSLTGLLHLLLAVYGCHSHDSPK
jgi:hypothetical protein